MRQLAKDALAIALFAASLAARAAATADGGGRDVSVALFSTRNLHVVTVTPIGPDAWIAPCGSCAHQPLKLPLHLTGNMEIHAGGMLRVTDDATGETRTAAGLWHLRGEPAGHAIDIVLTLPSERYVAAVLNAEAAPDEPPESLRALAMLARTYALNGVHFATARGHLPADLCDSTACEAMTLAPARPAIEDAVRDTAGQTVWFGRRRAEVFFSQSCGGIAEDAGAVWPALQGLPYLRSHADPYCLRRNPAAWHAEIPLAALSGIAHAEGWRLPVSIAAARVVDRSASHRALRVAFTGSDSATASISASTLRFGIGRALGWDRVRSDLYDIGVRNGAVVFDGRGHGHGVGLCQQGAAEMAAEGKTAREILAFYLPGTTVRILPTDNGWLETRVGALSVRSTQPLTPERKAALAQAWSDAQRLFPPRHPLAPEIVFAPSTELFRQLASQPGWALASTSGNRIVLQPERILQLNRQDASAILRHEMLHVLVEAEATGQTPLWLREGLVEVLADEQAHQAKKTDEDSMVASKSAAITIDSALAHAGSLLESQGARRAAAVRVRALIGRYGMSAVRGWLASGAPASAA